MLKNNVMTTLITTVLILLAQNLHQFIWDDYCSWYLELSKAVLNNPDNSEQLKTGTRRTLVRVLDVILRLLHPLMPFITEEIWQSIKNAYTCPLVKTIMLQAYPVADVGKNQCTGD